ncbi:MAG: hypothetical protein ACR2MP_08705 [Streptosporangiaceae bacterium]
MLAHEPDDGLAGPAEGVPAGPPPAGQRRAPSPDREVLDAARFRLSTRDGSPVTDPALDRTLEDVQSVAGVRLAARYGVQPPPGQLDLGASLVLLGNLRLYLDSVEADLFDAAADVGMSWDLIAAILGMPAEDARHRLRELRTHPDPR